MESNITESNETSKPRFSVLHAKPLNLHVLTEDELENVRNMVFANMSEPDAEGCRHWLGATNDAGYGYIHLAHVGQVRVHRLVCELVHGEPVPSDMVVHHTFNRGHEGCCAPDHLRVITQSENNVERVKAGNHNTAKLNEARVRLLRFLYRRGWTLRQLSKTFGVSQQQVSKIVNRRQWAWLEDRIAA